jgi:TFIIF-interacting CTD phosphatase-like protein
MNIVLDIDGTLVWSNLDETDIRLRPHLKEFLDKCFSYGGSVSIWTAANLRWANKIYDIIKPLMDGKHFDLIYTGEKCAITYSSGFYSMGNECKIVKPLKKMFSLKSKNYKKTNTIIIDDTPMTYSKNYGNAILVRRFYGDSDDTELLHVMAVLDKIYEHYNATGNVRDIDKFTLMNNERATFKLENKTDISDFIDISHLVSAVLES